MTPLDLAYEKLKLAQQDYLIAAREYAQISLLEHAALVFDVATHIDAICFDLDCDYESGWGVRCMFGCNRDALLNQCREELNRHRTAGYYDDDDDGDCELIDRKPFKYLSIEGGFDSYKDLTWFSVYTFPAYHSLYWLFPIVSNGTRQIDHSIQDPRQKYGRVFEKWVSENLDAWLEMTGRKEAVVWILKEPDGMKLDVMVYKAPSDPLPTGADAPHTDPALPPVTGQGQGGDQTEMGLTTD